MPRSTRKRKSGGRKRKSMKGGEGLSDVAPGIREMGEEALDKAQGMGKQAVQEVQGVQAMASQKVQDAKQQVTQKVGNVDASIGNAGSDIMQRFENAQNKFANNQAEILRQGHEDLQQFSVLTDNMLSNAENTVKEHTSAAAAAATLSGQTAGGRRRKRRQRGGDNGSTTMAEAEEGAKRDAAVKQLVEELKASIRNVEAAERKMNMNGTHGIPEQEHLEEALAALEKMVTAENKLRTEFKKQVRARVSAIHADPMDHAANLLESGRSQLTTALRRTQNDAKKAVTGVVDQAVEDANNLISGEDDEDGGNSENNRGILGRIASIFGGKKRRRKSKGKKKRKGRKTKRRPKKGQRSKTRKGRLDFVTHKGDKYYNRNGHRQTRNRKGKKGRPYASRKRR